MLFLRVPGRFRRVRDPNGTILTTFGLPAGPGPKMFSVGGAGSPEKFFPKNFFLFKNDIHWVLVGFWAQKNSFWTPLDPPKGAILAHFTHKMAKMGFKTAKNAFF